MDNIEGLQLLAENSWGVTRKILYKAKEEIEGLRQTVLDAEEGLTLALIESKREGGLSEKGQERLTDIMAEVTGTATVVRSRLEDLESGK